MELICSIGCPFVKTWKLQFNFLVVTETWENLTKFIWVCLIAYTGNSCVIIFENLPINYSGFSFAS